MSKSTILCSDQSKRVDVGGIVVDWRIMHRLWGPPQQRRCLACESRLDIVQYFADAKVAYLTVVILAHQNVGALKILTAYQCGVSEGRQTSMDDVPAVKVRHAACRAEGET